MGAIFDKKIPPGHSGPEGVYRVAVLVAHAEPEPSVELSFGAPQAKFGNECLFPVLERA